MEGIGDVRRSDVGRDRAVIAPVPCSLEVSGSLREAQTVFGKLLCTRPLDLGATFAKIFTF